MNSFSPVETLDIVASVIATGGAPDDDCGSCCDCGALGCSWANSDTTGARRAKNTRIAARVVIGRQIAGKIVVRQALRLPSRRSVRPTIEHAVVGARSGLLKR